MRLVLHRRIIILSWKNTNTAYAKTGFSDRLPADRVLLLLVPGPFFNLFSKILNGYPVRIVLYWMKREFSGKIDYGRVRKEWVEKIHYGGPYPPLDLSHGVQANHVLLVVNRRGLLIKGYFSLLGIEKS